MAVSRAASPAGLRRGWNAQTAKRLGMTVHARRARSLQVEATAPENVFRRDGEMWTLRFAGQVARLPDAKGLHDIARLLATPGREASAVELVGVEASAEATAGSDPVLGRHLRESITAGTRCANRPGCDIRWQL